LYVARLNVIRAIRDLPEPPHEGRRLSVLVGGALLTFAGGLMTIGGLSASNAILALAGPAILGAGVAMLLLGRVPTRPTISIISVMVIVWSVISFSVLHHAFQKAGSSVFVVQGLVLNVYAVLLVTFNQQAIGATVRAIGGGARNMSLRLGLAYPIAKRFRTGLLLAMYAIVVFVLVLFTTISRLFGGQINDQIHKVGGNASIVVDSNASAPVPATDIAKLPGVTTVAATAGVNAEARSGNSGDFVNYTAVGYGADFIDHGAPVLHSWAKQYPTAQDAYRGALNDPTKILVGRDFGGRNFGRGNSQANLGDTAQLRDRVTGQLRQLTIVGLVTEANYDRAQHVYVSRSLSDQLFGARSTSNLLFVTTAKGTDNDKLAASINGTYVSNGADANSFHHLVKQQFTVQTQFLTLIQGYVGLGLLVGIAGLGVVMVRAVRERRREVGVLRSLGFRGLDVRRAFMAESSFVALEGIGLGTVLALITAWRLTSSSAFGGGVHFAIPWVPVIVLIVVTYIASLIATAAPAIQASHIRPAVALRIAD
jgi:putative ABC transport system permease protein